MNVAELVEGLPPALQLVVLLALLLLGGTVGFRRGRIQYISARNDEKVVEAESQKLDDNADLSDKLRSHEIRLRELEACIFGLAVHFSNLVLCEPCKHTNHQLLRKISETVAHDSTKPRAHEREIRS